MIIEVVFDVEVPKTRGRRELPYVADLNDFILSNHRTMCYRFDDRGEADRMRSSIYSYCSVRNLPLKVMRRGSDIYIVKP